MSTETCKNGFYASTGFPRCFEYVKNIMLYKFKYEIIIVYDNGGVWFLNSFSFIEFNFTFLEQHAKKNI